MINVFFENNDNSFFSFTAPNPSEEAAQNIDDALDESVNDEENDGSVTINVNGKYIHCLTIIGQIEGHYTLPNTTKTTKYEHIIPRIVAIEENKDVSGTTSPKKTKVSFDIDDNDCADLKGVRAWAYIENNYITNEEEYKMSDMFKIFSRRLL